MPINWIFLYLLFILLFILFTIINYFYKQIMLNKMFKNLNSKVYYFWKW